MQNRIVEIATDGVHLSLTRGFLKLSKDGSEIGRVALPDIGGVVLRGYGSTVSVSLIARLAEEKVPVIICGADQSPASVIWPLGGHHGQGHIINAQSQLTLPQKKRLWQQLVREKIRSQARALEAEDLPAEDLFEMAKRVKSGDPENLEAQAARRYWPRMMGDIEEGFKRDQAGGALNGWLNYGYAVLRAGAARSILVSGLHPSLSIHHESRGEALRLASDIMEPFRPWVDLTIRRLAIKENGSPGALDRDRKAAIVRVLSLDLNSAFGASPLQTCMDRLCQSMAKICLKEATKLELPDGLAMASGGMAV